MNSYIFPEYGSGWRQQIDPYLQPQISRPTNLHQKRQGIYTQQNMETDKQKTQNMSYNSSKHGNKSKKIVNNLAL
jgi:hypothetical protein